MYGIFSLEVFTIFKTMLIGTMSTCCAFTERPNRNPASVQNNLLCSKFYVSINVTEPNQNQIKKKQRV
jgi:hypothetical protein